MLSRDSDVIIAAGNVCGNQSKVVRLNEEETAQHVHTLDWAACMSTNAVLPQLLRCHSN